MPTRGVRRQHWGIYRLVRAMAGGLPGEGSVPMYASHVSMADMMVAGFGA